MAILLSQSGDRAVPGSAFRKADFIVFAGPIPEFTGRRCTAFLNVKLRDDPHHSLIILEEEPSQKIKVLAIRPDNRSDASPWSPKDTEWDKSQDSVFNFGSWRTRGRTPSKQSR
jgi:hypothetical protein